MYSTGMHHASLLAHASLLEILQHHVIAFLHAIWTLSTGIRWHLTSFWGRRFVTFHDACATSSATIHYNMHLTIVVCINIHMYVIQNNLRTPHGQLAGEAGFACQLRCNIQRRPQLTSLNNTVERLPKRVLHTHQNETCLLHNLLCQLQWLPLCESLDVV